MLKTAGIGIAIILIAFVSIVRLISHESVPDQTPSTPPHFYGYKVVHEYPHDPDAMTQGLIYHDGFLYESTGLTDESTIRKVRLETGEVVQRRVVDSRYSGEGLTEWHGKLLQVIPLRGGKLGPGHEIWKTKADDLRRVAERLIHGEVGVIYDINSLEPQSTFIYRNYEVWGLTHDDRQLIVSNGTSILRFLDPDTFQEVRRIRVTDQTRETAFWDELEFIDGEIYANVWNQDRIAIINPQTGQVHAWIQNLAELRSRLTPQPQDVQSLGPSGRATLNGIAYDPAGHRLFVTGKRWPRVFEIQLIQN